MRKRSERVKLNNTDKFFILLGVCLFALFLLAILFIYFGAEKIRFSDLLKGLFKFDKNDFNQVIVRNIRLPRLIADIVVGVSLAVAGAVMQGNTKNPMADSGIMGISAGSIFAIIVMVVVLPNATRLERIGFSCLGALGATLMIYSVAMIGRRGATAERMVLSGMAISTLFSSITSAIVLKGGLSSQLMKYTTGSSANTIWLDIEIAVPFFLAGFIVSLIIARSLTIMNLGEDVSKGLGSNVKLIKFVSTVVVLVLSAIAVVIIGPVGYVGLMVPHIVRHFVGTDYRFVIPSCAIMGASLVVFVDFLARMILAPLEFPVGVILTMIGVPFFIFISRRQRSDAFGG